MQDHTDTTCPTCGCDAPQAHEVQVSWWKIPDGGWPRTWYVVTRLGAIIAFTVAIMLMAIGALVVGVSVYLG